VTARNNARPISTSSVDLLTLRVRALKGAPVTATGTSGVYFLGGANMAVSSRTLYGDANGDVFFQVGSNTTGANTVTFTSGAVTTTAAFWVANAVSNARFVTLTGPATATANGELQNYTVTVKDRYGNAVSGANLSISQAALLLSAEEQRSRRLPLDQPEHLHSPVHPLALQVEQDHLLSL